MDLAGTSAIITGAGNGIGKAIALALAAEGVNIAIADIEEDAAHAVAEQATALGVKAIARKTDVTREEDITALADAAWAAFGSVELLFNNAGVGQPTKQLIKTTQADLDWVFAVNFGGVMNGIRVFGPRFIAAECPCHIINTGSEHSLGFAHAYGGLYTASKHAVLGLSDVLRHEMPAHVGVSVLCPGIAETTLWKAGERRQDEFGGAVAAAPGSDAAMRCGMPAEDVARITLEGVKAGSFIIPTHPHAVEFAETRWQEINGAFTALAPRYEGDERYDVMHIIRQLNESK